MDITGKSSTTESFWSMSRTNVTSGLREYRCKAYQSDTDTTKGVKIFCYCVVLLFSVSGNCLLIAVIRRNKRMQTITNYLIANMAVSDILITVLAVPRQITEILLGPRRWLIDGLLGSILCKSLSFFQDISTGVSILSLVVMAVDRYRGIVFPLRRELMMQSGKLCKIIILLIWIISMGLHLVYFYIFRLETNDTETYCTLSWAPKFDNRKSQEIYFFILLVCLIGIPTCVVIILYSAIILNLKRSRIASKGPSSCLTSRRLREDTKVFRIIVAILIAFVVCVIPLNICGILFYYVWDWKIPCGIENVVFAAHFILYSNASVNPCIYFILHDRYRRGLRDIVSALHIGKIRAIMEENRTKRDTMKLRDSHV